MGVMVVVVVVVVPLLLYVYLFFPRSDRCQGVMNNSAIQNLAVLVLARMPKFFA